MSHTDSLNLSALTGLLTEECRRLDLPERLITARGAMGGRIVFATSFGIEDEAIAHAIFTAGLEIDVVTSPVSFEADAPDLVIRGDLQKNLTGTLCRNGPNPQFAPRGTHFRWFLGAGMMHAFGIEDGRRFAVSCLGDSPERH